MYLFGSLDYTYVNYCSLRDKANNTLFLVVFLFPFYDSLAFYRFIHLFIKL
jgi:hypothetical protein